MGTQVAPYEVLYGPWKVYTAPVAEAFPAINASPAGNWALLGTNGTNNYDENGLKVMPSQSFGEFRPAGSTVVTKTWRIDEDFEAELNVVDMTMATMAKLYNNATVTQTAGPPNHRSFPLKQGPDVALFAVLFRADFSPYGDALKMQFEIYSARVSINGETEGKRDDVHKLPVHIKALADASGNFVTARAQY